MVLRMSDKDAKKAGLKAKKPRKRKEKDVEYQGDPWMEAMCRHHGLPYPDTEYRFHPTRKWRFDWLFGGVVALEKEGAVWTGGRHTRGGGFIDDMEKYNEAQILGYIVIRATPKQIKDGDIFPVIKRALGLDEPELP